MSGDALEIEILAWLDEFAPGQECRGLDFARARTRGRAAPRAASSCASAG